MTQAGGDLDLAEEALGSDGAGQLRPEDLHGDRAVVLQVLSEVDGGHPAATELALDRIAVGKGDRQDSQRVGHGPRSWGGLLRYRAASASASGAGPTTT